MVNRRFKCTDCGHEWEVPHGVGGMGRQMICPKCNSNNIYRIDLGGHGHGSGYGRSFPRRNAGGKNQP